IMSLPEANHCGRYRFLTDAVACSLRLPYGITPTINIIPMAAIAVDRPARCLTFFMTTMRLIPVVMSRVFLIVGDQQNGIQKPKYQPCRNLLILTPGTLVSIVMSG